MAIVTDGSSIDELVQYVRLYKPISTVLQGTILPFLLIYPAIFYTWVFVYGWNEHYEAGFVIVAGTAVVQILICLCCYWSVHVNCFLSCTSVNDPLKAKVAKVVPMPNNGFSEIVKLHSSKDNEGEPIIWFMFQKTKYVYDWEKKTFATVAFPLCRTYDYYLQWKGFSDDDEVSNTEVKYGRNEMEMVIPEFMELFKEKATAPFFVFQVFCVALWCLDKYWYYSIFTLVMLIMFECTLVHQQLRNMAEIRKMGNSPYSINVYRSRTWRPMLSTQLVPGDIVSLTRSANDNLVPCDIVLLRGSCIVDESMLTGESVPQMKEPLETEGERWSDKIFDVEGDGKLHMLFGGTKIVQHSPPNKTSTSSIRAPNNGCVGYVVRTGFNTSQGKLLRTILFGVKRVTANNLETFGFILFLLIFAIAAAAYVWVKGCEDPERNRYKLFLECTLILTSVVPPELPIELSLAVNTSLISLSKLGVFCTEPFRIPFAGKIEICCFDKTGTLTSDNLVVEGVAGVKGAVGCEVVPLSEAPIETIQVLATCHSLVQLDDGIVGDPLEKATLAALDWNLTKGEAVIPKKGKQPGLKIFHRHHFSSALKRMSVLAGFQNNEMGFLETNYIATVKGAPETLKHMFSEVPSHYDDTYLSLSRRGARVLALGYRALGKMSAQEVRDVTREHTESKLNFVGFVIISCPLKSDSKKSIAEIMNASHSVVMITGDNPLTACHVAKELKFTQKSLTLVCVENEENKWHWESIDSKIKLPLVPESLKIIDYTSKYDFCITGEALTYLSVFHQSYFMNILPHIVVFARFAPKQKEYVITQLKALGFTTLMCGDGTNDVGALKHADVGVAILSNAPEKKEKSDPKEKDKKEWNSTRGGARAGGQGAGALRNASAAPRDPRNAAQEKAARAEEARLRLKRALRDLDEADQQQLVRLGDASVAAPFTSRMASVACICHIIKQGRCTLVTTLQMFKILALNALILAYSQSVLYLDGIKFSDGQATLQGLLLASCFLFISRSKPLSKLSKERPLPNIFNVYTIITVLLQFFVHFVCLIYLVKEATIRSPPRDGKLTFSMDEPSDAPEVPFVPDLLNSTVYIISMALQISTFAINYRGEPFMEGLSANRPLLYSIICSGGAVMALALGLVPDLASQFEIVNFPPDFRIILVQVLVADMAFAYIVDRACMFLFGEGKLRRS